MIHESILPIYACILLYKVIKHSCLNITMNYALESHAHCFLKSLRMRASHVGGPVVIKVYNIIVLAHGGHCLLEYKV